jgi:hypothetical protein
MAGTMAVTAALALLARLAVARPREATAPVGGASPAVPAAGPPAG